MRYLVITTLAALAGFFACRTTDEAPSTLRNGIGASSPPAQTIARPAAEALLTVLYGN